MMLPYANRKGYMSQERAMHYMWVLSILLLVLQL